MENYKSDEILKLENRIAQLEEKMLQNFNTGNSREYNKSKNEQWRLINKLNKIKSSDNN
jgi:hypothetical protein